MPKRDFSQRVRDLVLDLVWSLWAELGASGWTRRHSWHAIDLEPLIVFTTYISHLDARLRDESMDWCVSNGRFVSAVRLRNLLRESDSEQSRRFADYAATVKTHTRLPWPGDGKPWLFTPSGRSLELDLSRPALIQLRLRATVGVSARAEVLRLMLAQPERHYSASELALAAAYGKGNTADALEMLSLAGVAETQAVGNRLRYHFARPAELVALLGGVPSAFPNWSDIFRVIQVILNFSGSESSRQRLVRAADIRRTLHLLEPALARLDLPGNLPRATGVALNDDFEQWALALLREWAGSEVQGESKDDATYTVHRLATGDWVATMTEPGQPPRAIELPEWADLDREAPRSDTVIADDSIGAPRLAHALLADANRRVRVQIGEYWSAAPHDQLISRAFAEERLRPMRPGQAATFSSEFLRQWFADRKKRLKSSGV